MRLTKFATLAGITTLVLAAAVVAPAYAVPTDCAVGANCPRAPEIDPTLLRGALTVLVGGGLMLAERFRRR